MHPTNYFEVFTEDSTVLNNVLNDAFTAKFIISPENTTSTGFYYESNVNSDSNQLLRIVDVLGRESKPQPNVPFFYIYDDGTVEKKIIIE